MAITPQPTLSEYDAELTRDPEATLLLTNIQTGHRETLSAADALALLKFLYLQAGHIQAIYSVGCTAHDLSENEYILPDSYS